MYILLLSINDGKDYNDKDYNDMHAENNVYIIEMCL